MRQRLRSHLTYANVISTLALFIVLGGTAYAVDGSLAGQNTVGSEDIINGEVKNGDLGADAVGSGKIVDRQVKNADLGLGASSSNTIADGGIQGVDVKSSTLTGTQIADNSLKGADIDESTLDVAARAYAHVNPFTCTGTPGTCSPDQSKGVSSVTRVATGRYCVTAAGIDTSQTPAAVTVDFSGTSGPEGNASAMTSEAGGCGANLEGFEVRTERQPNIAVLDSSANPTTAVGPANVADDVAFTIVIP